jgi:Cof subfamily protein (haloacid dehalogenase superfamily)
MEIHPGNVQLIALDLDGTLLDRTHSMSARTAEAVRGACRSGRDVVICTGRRYGSCVEILNTLGCTDEVIVDNGILIKHVRTAKTLYSDYLGPDTYTQVIREVRKAGLRFVVLVDAYPEPDICIEPDDGGNPYHSEYVTYNSNHCREVENLDRPPSDKLIQLAIFEEYATLKTAEERLKKSVADLVDCFTIRGIRYAGSSLELIPRGASKWRALEFLLHNKGIPADRVLAIGDDVNDIELISNAGYGVAVANAFDEVKAAADFLAPDRDDDGAAQIIEMLL